MYTRLQSHKVTDYIYKDDIKIFAKNEKDTETLIQTIIINNQIGWLVGWNVLRRINPFRVI